MKLYVPNPQKWVDFFDRVSTGKANLNQSGAGRKPRVITVDQLKPIEDKKLSIKAVLPSEQTAAQAKSELERENINPFRNEGLAINKDHFISGSTLFVFQSEPNFSHHGEYLPLVKSGNSQLAVQFGKVLTGEKKVFFYI